MLVVISQIVVIPKPLSKKSAWSVLTVIKVKSSNVKPSATASSMDAIAIQSVNLPLGINQSVGIVQNVGHYLVEKKFVVAANKSYVANGDYEEEKSEISF